jgi:hypothetical protein
MIITALSLIAQLPTAILQQFLHFYVKNTAKIIEIMCLRNKYYRGQNTLVVNVTLIINDI